LEGVLPWQEISRALQGSGYRLAHGTPHARVLSSDFLGMRRYACPSSCTPIILHQLEHQGHE